MDQTEQPILPTEQLQSLTLPLIPIQEQPQRPPTKVSYLNLNEKLIIFSQPELKTVPTRPDAPQGDKQTYYQIILRFNYGLGEFPIVDEFYFEFCEVSTAGGLITKLNAQGRNEHSVLIKFDSTNKEHDKLIDAINRIYFACVLPLYSSRGMIRLPEFDAQRPAALFKNPVYRARDKMSGEFLEGRSPSMYLKAFSRGQAPFIEQTLFTDLNGKAIRWELLRFAEIKFIPLVHFKNIYCGTKASLQMEMTSAIVTKIAPRNGSTRQIDTIRELQQSRPELAETVAAQLARMTAERQDQILAADAAADATKQAPRSQTQSSQDQQATFNGITPTNQRQSYQQIPPPQQGYQQNTSSQQNYQQMAPPQQGYQQQMAPSQQNYQQQMAPSQQNYQQQMAPPQQGYQQMASPQQGYQNSPLSTNMGALTLSAPERTTFA